MAKVIKWAIFDSRFIEDADNAVMYEQCDTLEEAKQVKEEDYCEEDCIVMLTIEGSEIISMDFIE